MTNTLVPDVAVAVLPPGFDEQWVNHCPADLGVPEPQRGLGSRCRRPGGDVRAIPVRESVIRGRVAFEPADAIRSVRHNDDRSGPLRVVVQCVAEKQMDSCLSHAWVSVWNWAEHHEPYCKASGRSYPVRVPAATEMGCVTLSAGGNNAGGIQWVVVAPFELMEEFMSALTDRQKARERLCCTGVEMSPHSRNRSVTPMAGVYQPDG